MGDQKHKHKDTLGHSVVEVCHNVGVQLNHIGKACACIIFTMDFVKMGKTKKAATCRLPDVWVHQYKILENSSQTWFVNHPTDCQKALAFPSTVLKECASHPAFHPAKGRI